jgi:hypothetical protein
LPSSIGLALNDKFAFLSPNNWDYPQLSIGPEPSIDTNTAEKLMLMYVRILGVLNNVMMLMKMWCLNNIVWSFEVAPLKILILIYDTKTSINYAIYFNIKCDAILYMHAFIYRILLNLRKDLHSEYLFQVQTSSSEKYRLNIIYSYSNSFWSLNKEYIMYSLYCIFAKLPDRFDILLWMFIAF